MSLPMILPPWLQVSPQDYLSAAHSGLQSGLQAARIWQEANEFNTRLSEAAKENQMHRQANAEVDERNFLVQQQKNMMEAEYRHQMISQKQEQTKEAAEIAKTKAQEGIAHWQQMQKVAELRAKAGKVLGPGAAMVDDTGKVLYERPFKPSTGLTQEQRVMDQDLRQKITALDKDIAATSDEKKKKEFQSQRADLLEQRKQIGAAPSESDNEEILNYGLDAMDEGAIPEPNVDSTLAASSGWKFKAVK